MNRRLGRLLLAFGAVLQTAWAPAATVEQTARLVSEGHWREARQQIERGLAQPNLGFQEQDAWLFQRERMARMRLDFDKTRRQELREARAILPTLEEAQFGRWEKAGAIEFLDVDGERLFFHAAAENLFRVQPEARASQRQARPAPDATPAYRLEDIRRILSCYDQTGEPFNTPRTWRVTYALRIKPDTVPAGETIRAWLPFPQRGGRQKEVRLVSTDPPQSMQNTLPAALSSVYLEQKAVAHQATRFSLTFEYVTTGFYQRVDPERVGQGPPNDPELARFLAEQPPHLIFSEELKRLSQTVVGRETNPWLKARKIFQWVAENIPWAEAREYSTLDCLPAYAMARRHGDCGIQTMLFMALCRLNGIPARWESGWTTGPDKNMHDWCQIYLAPYGWLPVDVSYGLVHSSVEREKWFYLGGIDCHRLVVNTDYSQPLYPAKTFFRSEFIDFQRGEVEWRGGNLYFNQWDWDFEVAEVASAGRPAADQVATPQ